MRGFEDSTQPVLLNLDPVVTTVLGLVANAPVSIDGAASEATDYGILTNVSGTRYFIPWSKIYMIRQVQSVAPVAAPAVKQAVVVPTPPPADH